MSELMWHFIADNRLRDGSPPAQPGETEHWDGPVVLCESGLHACPRALDALSYAPSGKTSQVRLVTLGGTVVRGDDKAAASERPILASADCTRALHEFGLWCAEQVRHLMTDERSTHALDVKRKWLDGQATDDELSAARDAAWDAAGDAAGDAARAAAWAAVGAAAWGAARDAAKDAAWDAARAAAWNVAWDAARDAARAAAWNVAWDAARDVQNAELERRLHELLGV